MKAVLIALAAGLTFGLAGAPVLAKSPKAETAAPAAAAVPAYEPMAFFADLAGTAWRGEGTGPDGKPIVDNAYYEMILGGRAFQSTHRIENGSYGGRTIFFYDEGAKKYLYHYFTTAGFHTMGEIIPTEHGFTSVEAVIGHPTIVEVRAEAVFGDDTITVTSQHVDNTGKVSGEEGFVYHRIDRKEILLFDEADALFGKRADVKDAHDRYSNTE
ncbi:MAG: hypothetical protein R3C58_02280 [Parvularculaceae bacterium]